MPFKLNQETRQAVHKKHKGKCGYCGVAIDYKQMQVDHIIPRVGCHIEPRGWTKGTDSFENLMPACRRCNYWKHSHSVEEFRKEISLQHERLKRDARAYNLACDFGLVKQTAKRVVFHFERKR